MPQRERPPPPRRSRPRRRARPGARAARARDRGGGRAQPAARRPARHRQDDARAPAAGDPAAARRRRESLEVTRIHSVAGLLAPERPLVDTPPFRAPHHSASMPALVGGGPARGPARRRSPIAACCSSTSCRSSSGPRSRRCASRSRTASSASPASRARCVFPARFQLVATMNLCPCGGARRPGARVLVLGAAARGVPRQALARAHRPVRPRRDACRARARSSWRARRARRRRPCASACVARASGSTGAAPRRTAEAIDAPRPRGRAAAALRARAGAGRACRAHDRRARRLRTTSGPSTSPRRSRTARRGSSSRDERAGARRVRRGDRWARARRAPDGPLRRVPARLRRGGVPARRSTAAASAGSRAPTAAFPPLLRAIHDPPAGPVPARRRADRAARAAGRRRSSARARARRTARRSRARSAASWPPQGWSSSAGSRAASTARRTAARSRRAGVTVAVLGCGVDRDYPASHRELAARDRRAGARRLGVRARRRAGAVALSGAQPDRRGPRRRRPSSSRPAKRSGALITADLALEEGRDVFAVPGEITSRSQRGHERAAPARGRAAHARPATSSRRSASSRPPQRPSPAPARKATRRRCSVGSATARPRPTSWRGRRASGGRRARGRAVRARARRARVRGGRPSTARRSPGRARESVRAGEPAVARSIVAAMTTPYWLDDATPTFPRPAWSGRADGGGRRWRHHRLLLRAGARATRACAFACTRPAASPRARAAATAASRCAAARCRTTVPASGSGRAGPGVLALTESALDRLVEAGGDASGGRAACAWPPTPRSATSSATSTTRCARTASPPSGSRRRHGSVATRPLRRSHLPSTGRSHPPGALRPAGRMPRRRRVPSSARTAACARWMRRTRIRWSWPPTATRAGCWATSTGSSSRRAARCSQRSRSVTRCSSCPTTAGTATTTGTRRPTVALLAAASATRPRGRVHRSRRRRRMPSRARSSVRRRPGRAPAARHAPLVRDLRARPRPHAGRRAAAGARGRLGRGGYSGHGNVLGFACGELVAAAIIGQPAPMLDLMRPARLLQRRSGRRAAR